MFPPQILYLLDFFSPVLTPIWQIIKYWWWLPLPFILWQPFSFLWLWWRKELWVKKINFILLEVKIPKEILKPVRAMEIVMAGLRQIIYQPPDWWEKWIDGQFQLSYSFEIASINGEPHFFVRIPEAIRDSVESTIYAQYPEAEISIADDYTKNVPQDIPNKEWNLWAADYRPLREDPYPIKTYSEFETEREAKEEKRIDPVAALLEAMAKIKPGEQLWVQITVVPVSSAESSWIKEGEKIRDELARRPIKKPQKSLLFEAADVLLSGKPPGGVKEDKETVIPPEMKLTPGERTVIEAIEKKIAKPGFKTNIRFIYLGKRDVFFTAKLRLVFAFFASYLTENLNGLVPWGKTMTKIHKSWFLPLNLILERRLYLRKRKIFKNYSLRTHSFYPRKAPWPAVFVLNIEEMASLFHFPGKSIASAPSVPRIEAKKGEAPSGLPTE